MKYLTLILFPTILFASIPAQFQGKIQAKWISNGESEQVIDKDLGYVSPNKVRIFEQMLYVESIERNGRAAKVIFKNGAQALFGYDVESRARLVIFILGDKTYALLY
jgi:hypothetical protein